MKIKGVITKILPVKSGKTKADKDWSNQDFIVEHESGEYPKSIVISVFNGKITIPTIGSEVEVDINIDVTEWEGKFYNKITAYKCNTISAAVPEDNGIVLSGDVGSDLPF